MFELSNNGNYQLRSNNLNYVLQKPNTNFLKKTISCSAGRCWISTVKIRGEFCSQYGDCPRIFRQVSLFVDMTSLHQLSAEQPHPCTFIIIVEVKSELTRVIHGGICQVESASSHLGLLTQV